MNREERQAFALPNENIASISSCRGLPSDVHAMHAQGNDAVMGDEGTHVVGRVIAAGAPAAIFSEVGPGLLELECTIFEKDARFSGPCCWLPG